MTPSATMVHRDARSYFVLVQVSVIALLALLAYQVQHSPLDIAVSTYFYDAVSQSFPLRHALLPDVVGRYVARLVPIGGALLCAAGLALSYREERLKHARAVLLLLFIVFALGPLLAGLLKHYTAMPRPMALIVFGGYAQWPESFWAGRGMAGGGALPSVHAVSGYVVLSLYFAGWVLDNRRLRQVGLAAGLLLGVMFGMLRITQGAHFLSQTLWSLVFVWSLCTVLFYPLASKRPLVRQGGGDSADLDDIWRRLSKVQVRRRRLLTGYGLALACILPFLSSYWGAESWMHLGVEWVGLALICIAIAGRCWCILYLGGHKGATLIDDGPYSVSRNPLYLFSMMAVAGIGAQSGSLLLGLILVFFVYTVFNHVISEEERLLSKVFGQEYADYCARVPRFGPRLEGWKNPEELTISVSGLWNTVRDALPYLLALPIFELVEWGQAQGWLPVLVRLP